MIFVVVVVGVFFYVWFCTHGTAEIGWFAVQFAWSFASVTMLRGGTMS
jgi:hypothetical protein